MQQQLKGQGYTESTVRLLKGTTIQYPGMGGGGWSFSRWQIIYFNSSTRLGSEQKITHFITCLYIEQFWK